MVELLRPYFTMVKLWAVLLLTCAAAAYVAMLHCTITDQTETIRSLEESVKSCNRDRSKLRAAHRLQAENLGALDAYYRTRKCMNLHNGMLTEEELSLK